MMASAERLPCPDNGHTRLAIFVGNALQTALARQVDTVPAPEATEATRPGTVSDLALPGEGVLNNNMQRYWLHIS